MAAVPAFLLGIVVTLCFWVYVVGDRARSERSCILRALWRIELWQIRVHRFHAEGKPMPRLKTEEELNGYYNLKRASK